MIKLRSLPWLLVVGLGALALVRPLVRIVQSQLGVETNPILPIALTLGISLVWIAVVGFGRTTQPVLTLVFTALTYAVLAMVLSGVLSLVLDGHLAGPLANPIAIVSMLVVNAVWGLATGGLALLVQWARNVRPASPQGQ